MFGRKPSNFIVVRAHRGKAGPRHMRGKVQHRNVQRAGDFAFFVRHCENEGPVPVPVAQPSDGGADYFRMVAYVPTTSLPCVAGDALLDAFT